MQQTENRSTSKLASVNGNFTGDASRHKRTTLRSKHSSFDSRHDFFRHALSVFIAENIIEVDKKVLVVGGTPEDKTVFLELGFEDVHICNIDSSIKAEEIYPYQWSVQDAENLPFEENEFDYAICHSMLHHLSSPHRGILEMLRVSEDKVLIVDGFDGLFGRIASLTSSWSGFSLEYEWDLPYVFNQEKGGVNNTPIPNFVYRWTKRELEKSVRSYIPESPIHTFFLHGWDVPVGRVDDLRTFAFKAALSRFLVMLRALLPRFFPRSGNLLACVIAPQKEYWPWLCKTGSGIVPNREWYARRFKKIDGQTG